MALGESAENDSPASPAETASGPAAERPRSPSASSVAPAEARDRLAEEEALLEQARKLLAQDPARALTLLHRHQSRFPNGELTAERMYLGVDCLSRLGKQAAAKREADALVERYPNSAYARRAPLLLAAPAR
jgi:TolA-binding protein